MVELSGGNPFLLYAYQIITLYTLTILQFICQLYFNKAQKNNVCKHLVPFLISHRDDDNTKFSSTWKRKQNENTLELINLYEFHCGKKTRKKIIVNYIL